MLTVVYEPKLGESMKKMYLVSRNFSNGSFV